MTDRRDQSSLSSDAYDTIHRAIRSGRLAPGQRLRFAELQDLCGMSVSPVREALVRLTAEGFTTAQDRRGFSVSALSLDELRDIAANRILLEGEALGLAIRLGDTAWEGRVVAAHHMMVSVPRERDDMPSAVRDEWDGRHAEFHRALLSACGSPILIDLCDRLFARADRYRRMSISILGQGRDVVAEHEAIMRLSLSRDGPKAVEALRSHYRKTVEAVEAFFARDQSGGGEALPRR